MVTCGILTFCERKIVGLEYDGIVDIFRLLKDFLFAKMVEEDPGYSQSHMLLMKEFLDPNTKNEQGFDKMRTNKYHIQNVFGFGSQK